MVVECAQHSDRRDGHKRNCQQLVKDLIDVVADYDEEVWVVEGVEAQVEHFES